jgi:hypothetical protein
MSESFAVHLSFSGPMPLENIFESCIFVIIQWTWPLFKLSWNSLHARKICTKLIDIGPLILVKICKDYFPNVITCKNDFPYCGPIQTLGTMNMNLHYVRKLKNVNMSLLAQWFLRRFLSDPTLFL